MLCTQIQMNVIIGAYNVTSNSKHFLLSQHPSSSTRLHHFKVITFLHLSTPAKERPISNFLSTFYRLNIDLRLSLLSRSNFPVPPRRNRTAFPFPVPFSASNLRLLNIESLTNDITIFEL